jgi:hypothetical protein
MNGQPSIDSGGSGQLDLSTLLKGILQNTSGGNRSASQASSVGGNANVSVNPTIVNNTGGGGVTASPTNNAPVSGSPYATGTSSAGGQDQPSWLSTNPLRSAPGAMAGYIDPLTGRTVDAGSDFVMPLVVGGAGLLFLMLDE